MNYDTELEFAQKLARDAGQVMRKYFVLDVNKETKSDGTPVTVADTSINKLVITEIKKRFPDDEIIGEEESTAGYGEGRRWICDPIDGTAGYLAGVPTSMFSLSLTVDGVPQVAVAFEPHRNLLFTSTKGYGSFCNGDRLKVSNVTFKDGLVALAPDYIRPGLINEPFMKKLLAYDKRLSVFDGAVYRSCMVATGRLVGFPHPRVMPYDIAAVHLIVEEAGGKVTGVLGQALDYTKDFRGAIISNGVAHPELLELFQ